MTHFVIKLKRLKHTLEAWNRETFGNVFDNVAKAEEDVK